MRPRLLATLFLLVLPLSAGEPLGKLPDWAQGPAKEAQLEAPPAGAEAWVLLDRQEVTYTGGGAVKIHALRLVRVLKGKGLEEGTTARSGLEGSSEVSSLKGWNLRPDGEMVKLERKDKITFGEVSEANFDRGTILVAHLQRVMEGSLVAFESTLVLDDASFGLSFRPMQQHPVRRWELAVAGGGPKLTKHAFGAWLPAGEGGGGEALMLTNLPPVPKHEEGCFQPGRFLPWVEVRFQDAQCADCRILDSWDRFAGWYHGYFKPCAESAAGGPALEPGLKGLQGLWRWFGKELSYKQVYLTKDRGLKPEAAQEVARKRYGDCKDLACLFIAQARVAGFEGFPVLARINRDPISPEDVAGSCRDLFNHVVVALRLDHTLGLPAEVETPKGRFLLVDATDPLTPLGWLSEAHRDAHLLICLPDGGQWVAVPEAALLKGELAIQLTGTAGASGLLDSDLQVVETGDAYGLRYAAHSQTGAGFRAYLEAEVLSQAINGKVEVLDTSDPLALDQPFRVHLKLLDPKGLLDQGSTWVLRPPMGLPFLPGPASLPGRKRQLPVAVHHTGRMVLTGSLVLPFTVSPLVAERTAGSSLRTLSWKVATAPANPGCKLEFRVEQTLKDAFFGFDRLDQGVEAWKQDRALVRALLEDGMALKPAP